MLKIFFRWFKFGSRELNEVGDPEETKKVKLGKIRDKIAREDLITDETSDIFCKAITGAVYAKRKLYSNDDEVNLRYRRKIILNGISFSLDRGDLVERSIIYNTVKIRTFRHKSIQSVSN